MKPKDVKFAVCYLLISLIMCLGATNPVSCELATPTNGATISGIVTLTAIAGSLVGPITRVEWFMDGQLIASTNLLQPPANFHTQ